MIPMVQPSPSVQSIDTVIATIPPIEDAIHKLHDLIFQIMLPEQPKQQPLQWRFYMLPMT